MDSATERYPKTERAADWNRFREVALGELLYGPLDNQQDAIQYYLEGTMLLKGNHSYTDTR